MANRYLDTSLVDKAIKFAVDAHANTERRGKGFPYVIHVLEAMEIVSTVTNDPELLAAAALHDTVEDTDVTIDVIRKEFGDRIAGIVEAESDNIDTGGPESQTWRERKQKAISRLKDASMDAKTVAIGDKLSNMRAIARDYEVRGDKLWELFHAPGGRVDHEWHYRGLAASLSELKGLPPYEEFLEKINSVFGKAAPELVDMDDYEVSGDGFTAVSYFHRTKNRMMKLYEDFVTPDIPERELEVSRSVSGMGIPVPEAYRLVTDGKRTGVEFERIAGKRSFARAISQEPDRLEEYSREFARMCLKLHSTPCDRKVFRPVEKRFLDRLSTSRYLDDAGRKKIRQFIDSVPGADTCIHGDLHIGNALLADGKEYWIDLADFAYGNPLYDLGMFYFVSHVVDNTGLVEKLFHISVEQIHKVWSIFVDEYFGSDADKAEIDERIAPFAAIVIVDLAERGGLYPGMWEFVEDKLLR